MEWTLRLPTLTWIWVPLTEVLPLKFVWVVPLVLWLKLELAVVV